MKYRPGLLLSATAFLFTTTVFAADLELIPENFPAAQKPAFVKERASLVDEMKVLDGRVSRYNHQCSKPKTYQAHKCNTDRLELFQVVDAHTKKVVDFNKRLAVIDKGAVKPESKTKGNTHE